MRATRRTRRTSTHALVARFKLSALLAHLTTKTLPTLIVVGLEVPVLAPAERPLPFATSLRSIVCFSRIERGTHYQRALAGGRILPGYDFGYPYPYPGETRGCTCMGCSIHAIPYYFPRYQFSLEPQKPLCLLNKILTS